jgi:hypothetical protein
VAAVLTAIEDAKRGKQTYTQQKAARAERQKREKRVAELEQQITLREERKKAIEMMMGDGATFSDPQRARELTAEYETLKHELETHYSTWAQLAEERET